MRRLLRALGICWGMGGLILICGAGLMGLASNPQIPRLTPMQLSLIFAFSFLLISSKLKRDSILELGIDAGISSGATTLLAALILPGLIQIGELAQVLGIEILICWLAACTVFASLIQSWIRSR